MSTPSTAEIASQVSSLQSSYATETTATLQFSVWRNGQAVTVSVSCAEADVQRYLLDLWGAGENRDLPGGYAVQDTSDGTVLEISLPELSALVNSIRSRTFAWHQRLQAAVTRCYAAPDLATLQALTL